MLYLAKAYSERANRMSLVYKYSSRAMLTRIRVAISLHPMTQMKPVLSRPILEFPPLPTSSAQASYIPVFVWSERTISLFHRLRGWVSALVVALQLEQPAEGGSLPLTNKPLARYPRVSWDRASLVEV